MAPLASRRPVAVIGLGCIGGSLARVLAAQGVETRGWSASHADREQAAAAGIRVPERVGDGMIAACAGASIVVLAVPTPNLRNVAGPVLAALGRDALVLHVGGLQRREALGFDDATHGRVLGAHPLAGSHESGFGASRPDLFVGCAVSIESRADAKTRSRAEWLWHTAGAERIEYRAAAEHDALMSWVSHLPQLTATALAATLAARDIDPHSVGTGARDTTRLAATALGSWPMLLSNESAELHDALVRFETTVAMLRRAIDEGNSELLSTIWEAARIWRRRSERREGGGRSGRKERRA